MTAITLINAMAKFYDTFDMTKTPTTKNRTELFTPLVNLMFFVFFETQELKVDWLN